MDEFRVSALRNIDMNLVPGCHNIFSRTLIDVDANLVASYRSDEIPFTVNLNHFPCDAIEAAGDHSRRTDHRGQDQSTYSFPVHAVPPFD